MRPIERDGETATVRPAPWANCGTHIPVSGLGFSSRSRQGYFSEIHSRQWNGEDDGT